MKRHGPFEIVVPGVFCNEFRKRIDELGLNNDDFRQLMSISTNVHYRADITLADLTAIKLKGHYYIIEIHDL